MKPWLRKGGIYLATLLSSAGINIIAPFYSEAAEKQGIHPWLIGVIYSFCPVAAFICSWYLPKYLEKIGRTTVLFTGLIIIGLSNITLVFLPGSSFKLAVTLSFISRITEGLGSACCMVTCNTTLTSDYPEDISRIVATIEIMSGIGLSAGPAVGSIIYKYSGFKMTCLSIGLAMLIYAPILLLIIGRSRKYNKTSENISITTMLSKPKVSLDMGMQITVMFSVGFFVPITQLYLIDEGVDKTNSGYWYSSETAAYMLVSLVLARVSSKLNKPKQMLFGNLTMVTAFLMLGPSPWLFQKSLWLTFSGLVLIGVACAFLYIPSMPHMIEVAQGEYGYGKDDRLNDVISGITNVSLCLGEFFGPLAASALYEPLGFRLATTIIAILIFFYGLVYLRYCDFKSLINAEQNEDSELVLM